MRAALERSGPGPRSDQRARQDGLHGPEGALAGVAGQALPSGGGGQGRAVQETAGGLAPVRLPRPQRLLAARRHRVRPGRRAQGGDLPAPGRPLPPGGGLPGRPGRDQSGGHRRLRQGRGRPGSAPGARAADNGAAPGPSRRPVTGRPAGARALPGRRTPRRQTPPPHHPGQERALPPDPVPLPGPAAPGRLHRRAPGAGRPLRPHPATPSAPTRACPGASPGSRPRTPPRSPRRPDRATTPAPSPRRARPPNPTPPTGPGCAGAGPSAPPAGAS